RSLAVYLPAGVDYCALAKTLIAARDTGASSYAPFAAGDASKLVGETPTCRGGVVPTLVTARRRAFVGWLGELLAPELVLRRALEGHPGTAATFGYASGSMDAVFRSHS